ncbi:hypothetical protein PR001_g21055, partial [Phytophthora rubi]
DRFYEQTKEEEEEKKTKNKMVKGSSAVPATPMKTSGARDDEPSSAPETPRMAVIAERGVSGAELGSSSRAPLEEFAALVESRVVASESDTVGDFADAELHEMYEEPDVCEGDGIISRKSAVLREGADILQSNDAGLSNAVVDSFLETIHAPSVSTCDAKG